MSIAAYQAVWNHSESKGSQRLVLLCLAEHADESGVCWPSIKRVSELTKVSKRQVSRALKELDDAGEIRYTPGDGRGNHSHYVILLPMIKDATMSPNGTKKGDISSRKDDISSVKGDTMSRKDDTMSSESIKNHKEPLYEPGRIYGGISEQVDNGLNGNDPDRIALETEMLAAISGIVKETFVPHTNGERFHAVRDAFIEQGITPQQVWDFEDWWRKNGFYDGPPALKSLQDNIKSSLSAGAVVDDLDDFQAYEEPMEVSDG